jgi:hypothetical protein
MQFVKATGGFQSRAIPRLDEEDEEREGDEVEVQAEAE